MLSNLVSNAIKYTRHGGTISISASRRDHSVVVEVADTGLGISPSDQVGLFTAFFRTTNPDALREPGTGLGLAIVERIAHRHGGSVAVSSQLGAGTTFAVTLPLAQPTGGRGRVERRRVERRRSGRGDHVVLASERQRLTQVRLAFLARGAPAGVDLQHDLAGE